MSNKACTGYHTYSGVANRLESQIGNLPAADPSTLWQNRPNQSAQYNWNVNDFNGIRQMANDAGFTQPEKGQFKRKEAKRYYSNCMTGSCC